VKEKEGELETEGTKDIENKERNRKIFIYH
jgi:hypothetical protein